MIQTIRDSPALTEAAHAVVEGDTHVVTTAANIEVEAAEIAQPETGTAGIGAVVRDNRARWARWETLNKDNLAERRELSYQYSLAKYAEYERRGQTRELMAVLREASTLFGDDAAWNRDVIRKAASEHKALKLTLASEFIPSGKKMGRPTHYPTEAECACHVSSGPSIIQELSSAWKCGLSSSSPCSVLQGISLCDAHVSLTFLSPGTWIGSEYHLPVLPSPAQLLSSLAWRRARSSSEPTSMSRGSIKSFVS